MLKKIVFILILYICALYNANAAHLIGGELSYECIDATNGTYRITLQVYRDCNCTECAEMDDPAYISIFDDDIQPFEGVLEMPLDLVNEVEEVIPNTDNLCTNEIPDVCVERSTGYSAIITLPPQPGGYKLVYQRCCRNNTINNIINPGSTGSTYEIQIPDPVLAECNNSPTFNNFPPIIICAGYPLIFDHAATDVDGDSLVYEMCTPFEGATPQDPYPNVASDPPYTNISWAGAFNVNDQIGGTPALTIDSQTGLLTGNPAQIGQFVVGICVKEYRDGNLLSTSIRDFQFNITDCNLTLAAVESDEIGLNGEFILNECGAYNVNFINQSSGADSYFWDFGDLASSIDSSTLENPSYQYPDTGIYNVTLVANPFSNCADTAIIELNLFPLLEPDFNFNSGCSAEQVEFFDASTSQYGIINSWFWEFGENNQTSANQNPVHLYSNGGNFPVMLTITNNLGCSETIQNNVLVNPTPIPIGGNSALCLDAQPIQFSDLSTVSSGNIISWFWNFGDNITSPLQNPTHTFANSGSYTISLDVVSDEGCENTFTTNITIYDEIVANAGLDNSICFGEQTDVIANANVPATFSWSPIANIITGANSQTATVMPDISETFTLVTTDPNGCEDNDEVLISVVANPNINAGEDQQICFGETAQLNAIASDANGNTNNIAYQWNPASNFSNANIANPTISPEINTTYFLTVTDILEGCTNSDTIIISVVQPINGSATGDTSVCRGSSVQLFASGGENYSWSPATNLDNPNVSNPIANPLSTTNYSVDISNVCFSETIEVMVQVLSLPQVDAGLGTELNIGETYQLQGISETSNIFTWSPATDLSNPNIANPIVQPLDSRYYTLTVTGTNGCRNTDSVFINVTKYFDVWIGNAFTPNDDGNNDQIGFLTRGIKQILFYRVFNRWGQLLYEGNDFDSQWDGNFNGEPQEVGTYIFYIVGLTYEDNQFPFKGNITLIR